MKNVMGIINLGEEYRKLNELTQFRCLASVPFGAKYRLIDFVLSNMVNSGIQNVGIYIIDKYRSLLDHVGTGGEWDLDRKKDGLFILPPVVSNDKGGFKGDIQNFHGNLDYLNKSNQEYVIISGSCLVCNINYREALNFHIDKKADITVLCKDQYLGDKSVLYRSIEMDNFKVINTQRLAGGEHLPINNVFMDTYIMKKTLLIDLLNQAINDNKYLFLSDLIFANIDKLKVFGYIFTGYVAIVNCLACYYNNSLKILQPEIYKELFWQKEPIYTKTKNEPPTKYMELSDVKNSLLANGCIVEGKVENSILFNGVKIHKGATVRNSIIFPGCEIGPFAEIENCVLEKEVCISEREVLKGDTYTVFGRRSVV